MAAPDDTAPPADPPAGMLGRRLWMALGYGALALGIVGAALPLLPTTPFLLLAAWAFAKGNPRLRDRLHNDPRFGPMLRDWQVEGAIPRRGKVAALTGLTVSWVILALTMDKVAVVAAAGVCMALVALYIVTRPSPSRAPSRTPFRALSPDAPADALQNEA